jgi:hypothetical protein
MRIDCKYIIIHISGNKYFDNLVLFVKEHFDTEEYKDSVIVIDGIYWKPESYFRQLYPNKKIILYNWEQMVSNNTYFNMEKMIESAKWVDEVWDYDYLNKEFFSWYKINVDKVIPIRYTESIKCIENKPTPSIDVILFGYMNDVRLNKLKKVFPSLYHDYSFMIISGMDRQAQKEYISNSKIVLNLHGIEPYCRQEQERIAFSLINEKCILSETSQINYFGGAIVEENLEDISNTIKHLLKDDLWREVAIQGNKMFKEGNCNIIRNEI